MPEDHTPDTLLPVLPDPSAHLHVSESRLNSDDRERTERYFSARHAGSTLRAYRSDWEIYCSWCESREILPLPASPTTVAAFLAAEADSGLAVSTIRRRVAAIQLAHRLRNFESPTTAELVRGTLRGIARTVGTAPNQKSPALAEQIKSMLDILDTETRRGLRDRAVLALGFAGAFRRSELAALGVADLERVPQGLRVHIRVSKTDQEGQGQVVPILRGSSHCPVSMLDAWLNAAAIREGPVFRRMYRGDNVGAKALSAHSIAGLVQRCAKAVGLDPAEYAGHSLRAGFLTSAAQSRASLSKMMEVSRHKDPRTVLRYIRQTAEFDDHAGEGLL